MLLRAVHTQFAPVRVPAKVKHRSSPTAVSGMLYGVERCAVVCVLSQTLFFLSFGSISATYGAFVRNDSARMVS